MTPLDHVPVNTTPAILLRQPHDAISISRPAWPTVKYAKTANDTAPRRLTPGRLRGATIRLYKRSEARDRTDTQAVYFAALASASVAREQNMSYQVPLGACFLQVDLLQMAVAAAAN